MIDIPKRHSPSALVCMSLFVCGGFFGCSKKTTPAATEASKPEHSREAIKSPPVSYTDRFEGEGLVVNLEVRPEVGTTNRPLGANQPGLVAFENAHFRFTLRDHNGAPIVGSYPAAWMQRRDPGDPAPDEEGCKKMIERNIEGSIFAQPDVDLNVFTVLVMNDDSSIGVVDPRFGFGGTKLLTMTPLEAPAYDWAISEDDSKLFVSTPMTGQIVFIETFNYSKVAAVDVGPAAKHLLLQPDEKYLWAAGNGRIVAIDVDTHKVAAKLDLGTQLGEMAIRDDSRQLFVLDRAGGLVNIIDTATLQVVAQVKTGWEPISMDWSAHAQALYVANRGQGTVSIVEPVSAKVRGEIALEAGLGELRFAPGDRFAFVLNPKRNLVHILDTASGSLLQSGSVLGGPNHVAFSDQLAYIRHASSDTIFMVHLDQLGSGLRGTTMQVVDFPAGHTPLGRRTTPAAGIVKAPGHSAVLVAHAGDRAVYFYKEGMAAPMGHFQNYSRRARAVLTVDRSLAEHGSRGNYETSVRLAAEGTYDLALFIDSPQLTHCFTVEVGPNPKLETQLGSPVIVEWPNKPTTAIYEHDPVELSLRLLSRETRQPLIGLKDVHLSFTLLSPKAIRDGLGLEDRGNGIYGATWTPSVAGLYEVNVSAVNSGLFRNNAPSHELSIKRRPAVAKVQR